MIKEIRLSAGLRKIAGSKAVDVHMGPAATARDLLHGLREANPALAAHILTAEGNLTDGIRMVVGGQHIDFLQGLDTPIGEEDDILLFPPLMGG
jgi:molybdopterin converting factor small subunit